MLKNLVEAFQQVLGHEHAAVSIEQRLQGIVVRDELTTEWRERGAEEGREFAILTEILHPGTFDVSTDEHRDVKRLKQRDNLRDNMTTLELALTMLSEAPSTTLHQTRDARARSPATRASRSKPTPGARS